MMKCTNENFRNVVCLLRYWPRGDVRGKVAWTNTENVSAGTRNQRKTEVGGDRICCFVPPKTFLRNKTPPQIHFVWPKTFIWNQIMWTPSVWP